MIDDGSCIVQCTSAVSSVEPLFPSMNTTHKEEERKKRERISEREERLRGREFLFSSLGFVSMSIFVRTKSIRLSFKEQFTKGMKITKFKFLTSPSSCPVSDTLFTTCV